MKKQFFITLFGATMAFASVSCSDDDDNNGNVGGQNDKPGKIEMTQSELETVDECNEFGFKLLKEVSQSDEFVGENLILSPISFNYAFSMLANGANGDTRAQIIDALGYDAVGIDDVNEMNRKLTEQLSRLDPKVTLNIANSMWAKADIPVKPDFISNLSANYDADVRTIAEETFVNDVNSWCSDKTNGKITEFMHEGDELPDFALFNAVYFKGIWSSSDKFNSKNTAERAFNDVNGTRSMARFMNQKGILPYNETPSMQKCELRFGNTSFRAAFILPKEGVTLAQAIDMLADGEWKQLQESYPDITVTLSLPKYKIENEIDFKELLGNLGMEGILNKGADFTNITSDKLKINFVKQKATFEINEEGAEAAAVTGTGLDGSLGPIETKEVTMTFDRPFIYVVYEQSTGAILFAGCINTFAK